MLSLRLNPFGGMGAEVDWKDQLGRQKGLPGPNEDTETLENHEQFHVKL